METFSYSVSRRTFLLGTLLAKNHVNSAVTPIQYAGDQQTDYLALLKQALQAGSRISAFSVGRPCRICRSSDATVDDFLGHGGNLLDPAAAVTLRTVLLSPNSYVWGSSIALQFVPSLGFLFGGGEPIAALLATAPLGDNVGQGRLVLRQRLADPSLVFVTFNQSIRTIAQIYADAFKSGVSP